MKFFMPIGRSQKEMKEIWESLNKLSNKGNPNRFKNKVFSISQVNSKLEPVYYDKIDGNFPDRKFPIVAIIETETSFDIYGAYTKEINDKQTLQFPVHSVRKGLKVIPQYFD